MTKKTKKEEIKPGTSLQEMDIASPGGNLESYINSIHNIGILTREQERKLAEDLYYRDDLEATRVPGPGPRPAPGPGPGQFLGPGPTRVPGPGSRAWP